jgi:hypothetical protein
LGNNTVTHISAEAEAGLNMSLLSLLWSVAQPNPDGRLNMNYLNHLRVVARDFKSAGLGVTLDPGLQYPPKWVFELSGGTRFVNQYGDAYYAVPATGEDVPDAVFNVAVRMAQREYLAELGRVFGRDAFYAVRVGGLLTGELRFPAGLYRGHPDSWWAFSPSAQAESPVPGYRPRLSRSDPHADSLFLGFYLASMARYQDFLANAVRNSFSGAREFMYPSFGVRPGDVTRALASRLSPSVARMSELYQGVDFASLVPRLPMYEAVDRSSGPAVAYTTWLDGPSFGPDADQESPVAYLAGLARQVGIPVAGENTQSSREDPVAMKLCATRAMRYGLIGVMWFNEQALFAGGPVDLAKLACTFLGRC